MVPLVGDVEPLLGVDGDASGPDHLARLAAVLAEVTEPFLGDVALLDGYVVVDRRAPLQHVQHFLGAQGQVHDVTEGAPGEVVHANGVVVLVGAGGG